MILGMTNLFSGSTLMMTYSYFSGDFTHAKALTLIIIHYRQETLIITQFRPVQAPWAIGHRFCLQ